MMDYELSETHAQHRVGHVRPESLVTFLRNTQQQNQPFAGPRLARTRYIDNNVLTQTRRFHYRS